tara:strand:+ start:450 stop:626 length:177 start_codon:yes stop_codon:yes gene_type:complete
MKQGFIILGLIALVLIIAIISRNASEVIDENTPIKSSVIEEPIIENKVYEKYEMSNYR